MFESPASIFFSPFIVPVIAIVAAIGVPIVCSTLTDLEKHKQECNLKRSMVERGMSVGEIERVLAARIDND